ncbi:MAG: hypothetical protein ABI321_11575 [Polyangia bacterium]
MAIDRSRGKDPGGLSPNAMLGLGLAGCAALVVVAAVLSSRFGKAPPPPPVVIEPAVDPSASVGPHLSTTYYHGTIENDAKAYKLPVPTLESLQQPLPYFEELSAPKKMKAARDQLDTAHLHLATRAKKEWSVTDSAQRMRVEQVMLTITNKSEHPIAYRVETHVDDAGRCRSKGVLVQNAIALLPGESVERSECLYFKGSSLEIRAIEVLELPGLGYFYTSRLQPNQVLLDDRTSAGHEPPLKMKTCQIVPWREIRSASEAPNGVRWADVMDFYARHNCDEYSFFSTYRRWTQPASLPARPQEQAPTPPSAHPLEPGTKSR